jgi:hypothetical protein
MQERLHAAQQQQQQQQQCRGRIQLYAAPCAVLPYAQADQSCCDSNAVLSGKGRYDAALTIQEPPPAAQQQQQQQQQIQTRNQPYTHN